MVPNEQRPSPGTRTVSLTLSGIQTAPTDLEQRGKLKTSISESFSLGGVSPVADAYSDQVVHGDIFDWEIWYRPHLSGKGGCKAFILVCCGS